MCHCAPLANLIARCLAQEPGDRPRAHQVAAALRETFGLEAVPGPGQYPADPKINCCGDAACAPFDCDDTDCGTDPACFCGNRGDVCTVDSDCCSNRCKNNGTCR